MSYERYYLSAQIEKSAIIHNCGIVRELIPAGCQLCPAVKCNAYGHGIEAVLPALVSADVEMLCVSSICEAEQVRSLGWERPVLLLGSELSIYNGEQKNELVQWLVESEIRTTPTTKEDIEALRAAANSLERPAMVHFMLDSGMTRMGLGESELLNLIDEVRDDKRFNIEGLYTHLATADEVDKSFANYQLQRFRVFVEQVRSKGLGIPIIHAANSAAAIDLTAGSHFNMIRPGISIYGYQPSGQINNQPNLKPCLKVVSFLILVKKAPAGSLIGYGCTYKALKDMLVGLVPIGYGDGYDRGLSNDGKMKIEGHLVPVVGRVSMDLTIVDLSELEHKGVKVSAGHEVIVIDNVREAPNSVESLASQLETIPYEITTRLGPRIIRVPV